MPEKGSSQCPYCSSWTALCSSHSAPDSACFAGSQCWHGQDDSFESYLAHNVFPRQRRFCFDVCRAWGGVPLTPGRGLGPGRRSGLLRCVRWRVQDPGLWAFRLLWLAFRGSSFWFCRVGRGWPTPVQGPGLLTPYDVADVGAKVPRKALSSKARELRGAPFVLPKGVRTV